MSMGLNNLEEFLKRKKESEEQKSISWEEIKLQWLNEIDGFFKQIEAFLVPLKEKGLLSFEREIISIYEEDLGGYDTEKIIIQLPDQKVIIEPIGKGIIGANGRIDMIGHNGSVHFLLVDKDASGPKFSTVIDVNIFEAIEGEIATRAPNLKYIALNEDSFSDALLGVTTE